MQSKIEFVPKEIAIACLLSPAEQTARRPTADEIFKSYQQVTELADGYAFSFPGDENWINTLVEFIKFERECCPFFNFGLIFEAGHGSIWLELQGGEGVKSFIEENMKH